MPARTLTMGYLARGRFAAGLFGLACGLALLALSGCGGQSPAPEVARTPAQGSASAAAAPAGSLDHGWGERVLASVPVHVKLRDARAWRARASGSFTLLEHPPTRSMLVLRIVSAPRLVRPEQCEADARLAWPSLPLADPSSVVERRALTSPLGFDTRVVVGVEPRALAHVHGFALAVGAATGSCYVASYETESDGPGAVEEVADRLALVVAGVMDTLRVPSAEERVSPPARVK